VAATSQSAKILRMRRNWGKEFEFGDRSRAFGAQMHGLPTVNLSSKAYNF